MPHHHVVYKVHYFAADGSNQNLGPSAPPIVAISLTPHLASSRTVRCLRRNKVLGSFHFAPSSSGVSARPHRDLARLHFGLRLDSFRDEVVPTQPSEGHRTRAKKKRGLSPWAVLPLYCFDLLSFALGPSSIAFRRILRLLPTSSASSADFDRSPRR